MVTIGASTLVQAGDVPTGDKREFAATRGGVGKFFSIDPSQVKVGGEMGRRIDLTIQKNLLVIETENQFLQPSRQKQSQRYAYIGLSVFIPFVAASNW